MDGSRPLGFRRWRWPLLTLAALLSAELVLRLGFGFCDAVLMRADPHYEYIAQPLQERHRFGRHIVYNSLSMRSEEPDSTAIIVLGCGDSVINGGSLTDNDSLATTLLTHRLTAAMGRKVQVLNIGAGSWGPDNCAAYLSRTQLPRSSALVLVVSSHDAHDNMSFKKVVGVRKHFPAEQYGSALHELIDRYLLPKVIKPKTSANEELGIDKGEEGFNTGFLALKRYAEARGIPFIIYLHAERSEIKAGRYNAQGQEILRFAAANGIRVIRDLEHGARVEELRDNIHPDDAGQRRIADILEPVLVALVQRGAY
ncbi:MAG: SGNH/GDSL hydrolase family protein [Flavobacteriales bacterium]